MRSLHYSSRYGLLTVLAVIALSACNKTYIPEDSGADGSPTGSPPAAELPTGTVTMPPPIGGSPLPPTDTGYTSPGGAQVHVVQQGETLYRIGLTYGIDYKTIAAWNNIPPPYALSPGQTLLLSGSGGSTVGSMDPTPPAMESAPAPSNPGGIYHTVRSGETLYSIAQQYGRSYLDVASWNGIAAPYYLRVGQSLLVSPAVGGAVATGGGITTTPAPTYPTTPAPASAAPAGAQYYTVQPGDTLYAIARRYQLDFRQIASWNSMDPNQPLSVGQPLLIYTGGAYSAPQPAPAAPASTSSSGYHTVQPGDTLYSLSRQYGLSVAQLASWNGLQAPYALRVGQRLRLTPAQSSAPSGSRTQVSQASEKKNRVASPKPATSTTTTTPKPTAAAPAEKPTEPTLAEKKPAPTPVIAPTTGSRPEQTEDESAENGGQRVYHTVQADETLADIARRYGQTVHEIALWNAIPPPYQLRTGQNLLVMPK